MYIVINTKYLFMNDESFTKFLTKNKLLGINLHSNQV